MARCTQGPQTFSSQGAEALRRSGLILYSTSRTSKSTRFFRCARTNEKALAKSLLLSNISVMSAMDEA